MMYFNIVLYVFILLLQSCSTSSVDKYWKYEEYIIEEITAYFNNRQDTVKCNKSILSINMRKYTYLDHLEYWFYINDGSKLEYLKGILFKDTMKLYQYDSLESFSYLKYNNPRDKDIYDDALSLIDEYVPQHFQFLDIKDYYSIVSKYQFLFNDIDDSCVKLTHIGLNRKLFDTECVKNKDNIEQRNLSNVTSIIKLRKINQFLYR